MWEVSAVGTTNNLPILVFNYIEQRPFLVQILLKGFNSVLIVLNTWKIMMMLTRIPNELFFQCVLCPDDKRGEKPIISMSTFLRAFDIKSLDMTTSTLRRGSCEHTIDKSCKQKETCSKELQSYIHLRIKITRCCP